MTPAGTIPSKAVGGPRTQKKNRSRNRSRTIPTSASACSMTNRTGSSRAGEPRPNVTSMVGSKYGPHPFGRDSAQFCALVQTSEVATKAGRWPPPVSNRGDRQVELSVLVHDVKGVDVPEGMGPRPRRSLVWLRPLDVDASAPGHPVHLLPAAGGELGGVAEDRELSTGRGLVPVHTDQIAGEIVESGPSVVNTIADEQAQAIGGCGMSFASRQDRVLRRVLGPRPTATRFPGGSAENAVRRGRRPLGTRTNRSGLDPTPIRPELHVQGGCRSSDQRVRTTPHLGRDRRNQVAPEPRLSTRSHNLSVGRSRSAQRLLSPARPRGRRWFAG